MAIGGQTHGGHGADQHRHGVDYRGGEGDADEHRHGPITGAEGQGHQLALVAELGNEDDTEAEQQCVHGSSSTPGGGVHDLDQATD
jgi:hypothetical protein